jgi:sugar/nucleoside kinase (ribokinase family)
MPRFDVTIAGELNLDLILYGVPDELPPERELLADGMSLTLGGSSSIVAHNLASLGSRVGFISCIGKDQLGEIALTRLAESGVNVEKVQRADSGLSTGITVILQRDKWRNMVTYSGTIAALLFEDLDFGYLSDSRHFHLSSFYLQLGLLPRIMELFKYLKAAGLTVSLDTNDDPENQWEHGLWQALEYVDVFLPNESEAKRITGASTGDEALAKLAKVVPVVAMKLGAKGAVAQRGNERVEAPGYPVELVDAVGAGDSFDAGFINQFVKGADLKSCLKGGNSAGALSTTRAGGTEAFRDRTHRESFLKDCK